MCCLIRWLVTSIVPVVLLLGASSVSAQNKEAAKDKDKDNTEKMIKAGVLVGRVANIYEDKRVLRLAVTVPQQQVNVGAVQQLQQAQLQMLQARAQGDWNGLRNAQISMMQARASLVTVEYHTHHLELQVQDDVIVRSVQPRQEFDDKGKIKRFTRAELKERKGPDPKLPGYRADFSDVITDQVVQVSLVRKKPPTTVKASVAKSKAKAKAKEELPEESASLSDLLGEYAPQISMIVIVADPPPGG